MNTNNNKTLVISINSTHCLDFIEEPYLILTFNGDEIVDRDYEENNYQLITNFFNKMNIVPVQPFNYNSYFDRFIIQCGDSHCEFNYFDDIPFKKCEYGPFIEGIYTFLTLYVPNQLYFDGKFKQQ